MKALVDLYSVVHCTRKPVPLLGWAFFMSQLHRSFCGRPRKRRYGWTRELGENPGRYRRCIRPMSAPIDESRSLGKPEKAGHRMPETEIPSPISVSQKTYKRTGQPLESPVIPAGAVLKHRNTAVAISCAIAVCCFPANGFGSRGVNTRRAAVGLAGTGNF